MGKKGEKQMNDNGEGKTEKRNGVAGRKKGKSDEKIRGSTKK